MTIERGTARYVRVDEIVCYWQKAQLVVENFMSRTRVGAHVAALRVLDSCVEPRSIAQIIEAIPEYRPVDLRRLVMNLTREGLLRRQAVSSRRQPASGPGWPAWNPAAGFFHFSTKDVEFPDSPTESADLWRARGPSTPMPSPVKKYPGARRVKLPSPDSSGPLAPVLLERRTWREFSPERLDLKRLSTILSLTWGVQKWATVPGQGRIALKTSPSGGARHAGEVYVYARRVAGLEPGIYYYEAARGSLAALPSPRRLPSISELLPGQPWYEDAPVLLIMTAVFRRAQWRYAFPRAYRAVLIEAGHLCQTSCLVATSLGLAPFCSMAFPDSRIDALLGLDGIEESTLYISGVGIRPRTGWRPWQPSRQRPGKISE